MVRIFFHTGLFVCVLTAPIAAAAAEGGVSRKDVAYIATGEFLADENFNARTFVRVLAALPALKKKNSRLAKKIRKSIKKKVPKSYLDILDYYPAYHTDKCVQRRVAQNIGIKTFGQFRERTLGLFARMEDVCDDLKKKRRKSALATIGLVLETYRQDGPIFLHRAILRSRAGDAAGAGADFREALKVPEPPESSGEASAAFELTLKAGVLIPVEECLCSEALSDSFAKLKINYDSNEAAKKEGVTFFLDGKMAKAIGRFDKAVVFDPGDAEAFMSRAVARDKSGREGEKAFSDYQSASKLAAAAGRWDMAAEALLSSAKLAGVDSKTALPRTVEGLDNLMKITSKDWKRREAVAIELKSLKLKLKKIMPKPDKKRPLPDGPDTSIPDVGVPDLKIPDVGGKDAAVPTEKK